jgi:hypothetical protein
VRELRRAGEFNRAGRRDDLVLADGEYGDVYLHPAERWVPRPKVFANDAADDGGLACALRRARQRDLPLRNVPVEATEQTGKHATAARIVERVVEFVPSREGTVGVSNLHRPSPMDLDVLPRDAVRVGREPVLRRGTARGDRNCDR